MKNKVIKLKIIVLLLLCSFCFTRGTFTQTPDKSPTKAFLFSLVFPGLGEKYTGSKGISNLLIVSELIMWSGYFGYNKYSEWLERDYKNFAVTHAQINTAGKTHQYYVDIGNFDSIYDYNAAHRIQRDWENLYPENGQYYWEWDSWENKKRFEKIRIRKDTWENRTIFFVSGMILNRLVSAIESAYFAKKINKDLTTEATLFFYSTSSGISCSLTYLF